MSVGGSEMVKATATDVRNNFGEFVERARRTPIVLQRNGRDTVVMLDAEEYKRLLALEEAANKSSRRPRRIGFAKGTFGKLENVTDKSHLEHFAEYMP